MALALLYLHRSRYNKTRFQEGTTMTAIMEPVTTGQVDAPTEPTVTFDQGDPLIEDNPVCIQATVIVRPPSPEGDEIRCEFPIIAVPGSGSASAPTYYAVIWTLIDAEEAFSKLELMGVSDPQHLPQGLQVRHSGRPAGGTLSQWYVSLMNQVSTTSAIEYNLNISHQLHSETNPSMTSIDPTIVVTMEPID